MLEETGYECELGEELGTVEYVDNKGARKVVRYWTMRPIGGEFTENDEVDEVRWLEPATALDRLTYERDRALLRSTMDPE